jgi:hypothetical protein
MKFLAIYGTRRFIKVLTTACHWSLSRSRRIQSFSQPVCLRSHLCLRLRSGVLPSRFPTKKLYAFLISSMRATCPAHIIPFHSITLTICGEVYKLRSSSQCSLLQHPVTPAHSSTNVFLRVRDQVSYPYKNR